MLLEAVDIDEMRNIQQDHGEAGLLRSHVLHERDLRAGERIRQHAAEHIDKHGEAIALVAAHGTDAVCDIRIGRRVAVIVVGPVWRHLLILAAIGLYLADGHAAGGDVDDNRTVRVCRGAAEDDGVRADETIRSAEGGLAGIGVAHHNADHIVLRHAVAVVSSAADVRAVAPDARCNTVFACAFQDRIIDPVHRRDTGAAAAVKGKRGIFVAHAAEVGPGLQSAGHILPQIDAETAQAVGIGACEIRVRDNRGQIAGVDLVDIQGSNQALDQSDLLVIRKMQHGKVPPILCFFVVFPNYNIMLQPLLQVPSGSMRRTDATPERKHPGHLCPGCFLILSDVCRHCLRPQDM